MGRKQPEEGYDPEDTCVFINVKRGDVLKQCQSKVKTRRTQMCRRHNHLIFHDEDGELKSAQKKLRKQLRKDPTRGISPGLRPEPQPDEKRGRKKSRQAPKGADLGSRDREGTSSTESDDPKYDGHIDEDADESGHIHNKGPSSLDRALLKKVDEVATPPPETVPKGTDATPEVSRKEKKKKKSKKRQDTPDEADIPESGEDDEGHETETADEKEAVLEEEPEPTDPLDATIDSRTEALRFMFLAGIVGVVEFAEQIISRHTPLNLTGMSMVLAGTPGIKDIIYSVAEDLAPSFADPEQMTPTKQLGMWVALSAFAALKRNTMMAPAPASAPSVPVGTATDTPASQ